VEDKIAFLKSLYAPENTNGYNRHAYIVRDYLKYPLNSYIEYNANLNAFDDEDALILYIIDNELEKQEEFTNNTGEEDREDFITKWDTT
jgi:restriction endonuclease S subunit